jgi:hypothetical protein
MARCPRLVTGVSDVTTVIENETAAKVSYVACCGACREATTNGVLGTLHVATGLDSWKRSENVHDVRNVVLCPYCVARHSFSPAKTVIKRCVPGRFPEGIAYNISRPEAASLIEAAPDLLAACERVCSSDGKGRHAHKNLQKLCGAALAKARCGA